MGPVRVRQDADLSKRERDMNDRCAVDMYDQLHQGAVRAGRDINETDDDEPLEGYVKPSWDRDAAEETDRQARKAEEEHERRRLARLAELRRDPEHRKRQPLERLALEVEVWNGRAVGSTPAGAAPAGKMHRHASGAADEAEELECSQLDAEAGGGRLTSTPSYIAGKLRDYQVEGVNWLLGLQARGVNGILADEMGLGKTFQTISMLAYVKYSLGLPGPHLIVVPKSVLGNWYREVKKWCPTMTVLKFHGSSDVRPALVQTHLKRDRIRFDVVLTTYDMILRELNAFKKVAWHYLIVDEAHKLKNADSSSHQAMAALQTRRRILITGTPLQNTLKELWALLAFLAPTLFDDASTFTEAFDAKSADEGQIRQLHSVVAATMLRRVKSEVNTAIPPKKEIYVSCGIAAKQREWYLKVLAREAGQINRATGSRAAIMNIIMQLRKAVNHPYLFPDADPSGGFLTDEQIIKDCGKMIVLDKLLAKLKQDAAAKHKVLLFTQMTRMLDIIEDYLAFRGYEYCRLDGSTTAVERDMQMAEFNNPESKKFIFILSTRAGGLGINLQAANNVIIYDSDWNPQMDLQAQDRAHRIGQTREVRVYRFVTDGTVEERVYQRALKKLYLDALIVQQGRRQFGGKKKDEASKDELMSMVRFGADTIFKSKGAEVSDADIDALLASGEAKMSEMTKDVIKQQQQTLANFDFGVEEANTYDFEGVKLGSEVSRALVVELPQPIPQPELHAKLAEYGEVLKVSIHPDLTKAFVQFRNVVSAREAKERCGYVCHYSNKVPEKLVVSAAMIDDAFGDGGRGKRERREYVDKFEEEIERVAAAKRIPAPKLPKKPIFSWWWLANEARIKELYEIESANIIRNWRREHERVKHGLKSSGISPAGASPAGASPTAQGPLFDEEDDGGKVAAPGQPESVADDGGEIAPLPPALEAERDALWAQAFTSWSNLDFRRFVKAITEDGVPRHDYVGISRVVCSKTAEEVAAYSKAFWELGPHRIPRFEKYEARVAKFTKQREQQRREAEVCVAKIMGTDGDPHENMKLPLKPLSCANADFDRKLFLAATTADGTFTEADVVAEGRGMPEYQFDVFMQSRPADFFIRRAQRLRKAVIDEAAKAAGPGGSAEDLDDALRNAKRRNAKRDREDPAQPAGGDAAAN